MKEILVGLLIATLPHWLSNAVAGADEDEGAGQTQVVVLTDCDTAGCEAKITGAGEGKTFKWVVATGNDEDDAGDGRSEQIKHQVLKIVGEADAQDRGWLGVSIGAIPEAVRAQLGTEERGVIILNVIGDSPADRAGLETHDIILSINSEKVKGDVGHVAGLIGSHKPGDLVDVVIMKRGDKRDLNIELGSRADLEGFDWKSKSGPLGEIKERIRTRGKFIQRDPGGKWIMKDLGEIEELADLPEKVRMFIPKSGSSVIKILADDEHKTITCMVERDGSVLIVEQTDGGDITVRRTDEEGNETVVTYADDEELRAGDEEAYDAFKDAGESVTVHLDIDGLEDLGDMDIDFDVEEWKDHFGEWQSQLDRHLGEAGEAYEQSMERFEELMERWESEDLPAGKHFLRALPFLHRGDDDEDTFLGPQIFSLGKPRRTFELRDDGKIEVRTRKGDSELLQVFEDEDDLAERDPKLHKKYQELVTPVEE